MKALVSELMRTGYLRSQQIIDAFLAVDRADFVWPEYKDEAYGDYPLPIGYGQTISQPATVAFMLELLQPAEGDKIMDVGSGSAWQTALLAKIISAKGHVYAAERIPELFEFGKNNLKKYGFKNVSLFCRDARLGLPKYAPFDKIIAAASAVELPLAWKEQLKTGGWIVAPIKTSVWLFVKKSDIDFESTEYPGFAFVPLVDK